MPPTTKKRVIFLDIDGVLINVKTVAKSRPDPACVKWLNKLTDATGANLVISSSWRDYPNIAKVLRRWGVKARVIGTTPRLESTINGVYWARTRGDEISAWLDEHRDKNGGILVDFIILDDDVDMEEWKYCLVQTSMEEGLTEAHVQQAKELFHDQED